MNYSLLISFKGSSKDFREIKENFGTFGYKNEKFLVVSDFCPTHNLHNW